MGYHVKEEIMNVKQKTIVKSGRNSMSESWSMSVSHSCPIWEQSFSSMYNIWTLYQSECWSRDWDWSRTREGYQVFSWSWNLYKTISKK